MEQKNRRTGPGLDRPFCLPFFSLWFSPGLIIPPKIKPVWFPVSMAKKPKLDRYYIYIFTALFQTLNLNFPKSPLSVSPTLTSQTTSHQLTAPSSTPTTDAGPAPSSSSCQTKHHDSVSLRGVLS